MNIQESPKNSRSILVGCAKVHYHKVRQAIKEAISNWDAHLGITEFPITTKYGQGVIFIISVGLSLSHTWHDRAKPEIVVGLKRIPNIQVRFELIDLDD